MNREVIPVVLKDALRQNLLNLKVLSFFSARLGRAGTFPCKGVFSCLLHPALGGDAARSEQLHHPQHFVPASLWLCISCLGISQRISLLLAPPWRVSHSCDIHSEVDIASSNLFYQSDVVTCGDTITVFILPFQSPLFFQVSAVISLDSDCQALSNFVFLLMASHYQCCAWSPSALHAPNLPDK